MPALRNTKMEKFARNWFEGMPKTEAAIQAGYKPKWAASIATRLSNKVKILERYQELQQKAEDESVASVIERKQILTEIARGDLLDYQEQGADGGYLSIGKDSPNTRAISEITNRTEYDKDGANAALITKVKLHSPTQAIDLLNKMDGAYAPERYIQVNIEAGDLTDEQLATIAKGDTGGGRKRIAKKAESPEESD